MFRVKLAKHRHAEVNYILDAAAATRGACWRSGSRPSRNAISPLLTSRRPSRRDRCRRTSPPMRRPYGIVWAVEFDAVMATAWAVAQNRAAERLGSEVEAARTAARAAEQAQTEADEALASADIAQDAAEADRDRLAVEIVELRAAADRGVGQRAAAEAERGRLVVELSQAQGRPSPKTPHNRR
jgi:hypothetical protein